MISTPEVVYGSRTELAGSGEFIYTSALYVIVTAAELSAPHAFAACASVLGPEELRLEGRRSVNMSADGAAGSVSTAPKEQVVPETLVRKHVGLQKMRMNMSSGSGRQLRVDK